MNKKMNGTEEKAKQQQINKSLSRNVPVIQLPLIHLYQSAYLRLHGLAHSPSKPAFFPTYKAFM